MKRLTIGELAKRTGVTIRALRHYHTIGLLSPKMKTESGYRLYDDSDIKTLSQIRAMIYLGFSLDKIKSLLTQDQQAFIEVLHWQAKHIDQQKKALLELSNCLNNILKKLATGQPLERDTILQLIKETVMIEQYYSQQQLDQLSQRRAELGDEAIENAQKQWQDLIKDLQTAMKDGLAPDSPKVQALAQQWQQLVTAFSGGDKGIEQSLGQLYQANPNAASQHGFTFDEHLMAYVSTALSGAKK